MAVEAKRGCGYRRVGGLYVVGGGLSAPCDRMPFPLERCRHCGGGIKFTRGPQWLLPDFFKPHTRIQECACTHGGNGMGNGSCSSCGHLHPIGDSCSEYRKMYHSDSECRDESPCPVCNVPAPGADFGPHLLLWIGRGHYTPEAYLKESRELGVSRRLSAMPKGLVLGETWVLLAHLDAVPPKSPGACSRCGAPANQHGSEHDQLRWSSPTPTRSVCGEFEAPKSTPGIFCAFVPRAVELILKESDATPERREKEAKRGVTVVAVPDDDRDHQGSVWDDKDEESQPELPGVAP